jgi:RNA polymerase sigma factor (sigma-70 family)
MQRTEAGLWRDWRRTRDEAAFRDLVVPELGRAVAVARGTGCDASAADDAVQDALVALARETTDEPLTLGVRTWLLRTVRDHARSSLRSERRRRDRERTAARPDARPPAASASETTEAVEAALSALSDEEREAVRLRYALDLDYSSVATILGTSEGAARVRVHRALERLRARFGEHATTLLGALPLPLVTRGEAFVTAAVAKAAAAGAGAAAGGGASAAASSGAGGATASAAIGGATMVTAKTVTAAGVIGLAVGAATMFGVTHVGGDATDEEPARSAAAPAPADAGASSEGARDSKRSASSAGTRRGARDPFEGLEPSADEREWARAALVAERERRTKAAILPSDTGADVMRRYFESGADVGPVLASFEAARAHIRPDDAAAQRFESTGETTTPDMTSAQDARVVEFGPGRFDLARARNWMDRRAAVPSLEVRGAGMDKTTLLLTRGSEFFFGADAGHVVFRDLTLLQPNGDETAFDVRGTVSMAFERVRFSDWCTSAGHSAAIGTSGRAFLACKDCEFLGPSDGFAVSVRGPSLAVFDGCLFSDLDAVLAGWGAQIPHPSTVVLRDCRFEAAPVADSRILVQSTGRPDVRILVRGARVGIGGAKADEAQRSTMWGAKYVESIEGVAYAAATPRLTASDALRVLDFAETKGWRPVVRMTLADEPRDRPRRVVLDVATERSVEQHYVLLRDGAPPETDPDQRGSGGRGRTPTAAEAAGLLPLRTLLAACTDLDGEEIRALTFEQHSAAPGGDEWSLRIETGSRSGGRTIDARTGSPLDRR